MPFINSKVTVKMSDAQKETVKARLGKAVSILPGKSESWLMVGFEDNQTLYFQGNQNAPTAFVEVKVYGRSSASAYNALTGEITKILTEELAIPANRIYVKYEEVENWGFNGENF